jgi:hypothetical protein
MSSPIKIEWDSGLQSLLNKLKNRPEVMRKAVGAAIFMEAEEIMAASKPFVPVDHGFLVASGHVQIPQVEGDGMSVEFGYGGVAGSGNLGANNAQDVGYGMIVHEDLTKHHPHGQAKYLEQPLDEKKQDMSDRLAGRIQARLT